MKSVVEPLEGNKVKLSVEVDEQEFESALDSAFKRMAREVRIPGFRPGKVPRRLLEARIGTSEARQEALREALPDYYARALKDTELDVIAPPEIDITAGRDAGPVQFDAVVEVRPHVAVPGYGGLRVAIPAPDVTDEEVETQIDVLRRNFGQLRPVSRPARDGDHVKMSARATLPGAEEPFYDTDDELYEVGSSRLGAEVDERLRGAKVGEILQFTANVPGHAEEERASFRILVKDVQEMELPEATDEWASEASEFDTVEELRADIRERMANVKLAQARLAVRDNVLTALTELVEDEPPEAMVAAEVEDRFDQLEARLKDRGIAVSDYAAALGLSLDALVEQMRLTAAEGVKADLALRAVADAEGIDVTDEDLDSEIRQLAAAGGVPAGELRRRLERADRLPAVRSDLRKTRALAWLVEHVEVVDEEGRPIDTARLRIDRDTKGEHPDTGQSGDIQQ